jgi:hypothetical protein
MVRRTIQSLQDIARGLFSGCLTETGACACATDIRTALLDYQIPSDEALHSAFQSDQPSVTPAVTLQSSIGPILQRRWNDVATALQ